MVDGNFLRAQKRTKKDGGFLFWVTKATAASVGSKELQAAAALQ